MTSEYLITFEPAGRQIGLAPGETILTAAQKARIGLIAVCDGLGTCHQCIIRLVNGDLNSPTAVERQAFSDVMLASGFRLACQAIPISDVTIDIPLESTSTNQRLLVESFNVDFTPDPVIEVVSIKLEPPSQMGEGPIQEQVIRSLSTRYPSAFFPPEVMKQLPTFRKDIQHPVRLAVHASGRVVGILPAGRHPCGLALDIGTTKLAAYLVDLEDGQTLARSGIPNPQIAFGEDVISRIAYANRGSAETSQLQKVLIDGINSLVMEICKAGGITQRQVMDSVAVGNTAMHHLFAGLPTRQLGEAPFAPAQIEAFDLLADSLGLELSPGAVIHFPPVIAGFVGADHIAADLACGLTSPGENTLLVDIGTNTEITLRTAGGLSCCSCASGPAFEGARIQSGMRASAGAIERVFYDQQGWHYQTIDSQEPIGICGSGILDAVAEMRRVGIIDERGTMQKDVAGVEQLPEGWAFRLVDLAPGSRKNGIHITRRDVNEIQLAKAAIRVGIEILLKENDLTANRVERVIVAGAFGTYLHIASALAIGMFPGISEDRFQQVGNAAGAGARLMLVSKKARQEAIELRRGMRYIDLTTSKGFQDIYMAALPISHRLVFSGK